jgi:hypothetical protein
MKTETVKIYQAWTIKEGRIGQDYVELKTTSKKKFIEHQKEDKRIIVSPIFIKPIPK